MIKRLKGARVVIVVPEHGSPKNVFWGWSSMLSTRACRMLVFGVGFVSCLEVRDNRMNFTSSIVDLQLNGTHWSPDVQVYRDCLIAKK